MRFLPSQPGYVEEREPDILMISYWDTIIKQRQTFHFQHSRLGLMLILTFLIRGENLTTETLSIPPLSDDLNICVNPKLNISKV